MAAEKLVLGLIEGNIQATKSGGVPPAAIRPVRSSNDLQTGGALRPSALIQAAARGPDAVQRKLAWHYGEIPVSRFARSLLCLG